MTNWFVLLIVFVIKLNELNHILADDGPKPPTPTASTNVSTVAMGSAFTMKCEMPANYTIGVDIFFVSFYYNFNGQIGYFDLTGKLIIYTLLNIN